MFYLCYLFNPLMRYRFILCYFCFFLLIPTVFSQEIIIKGKVFDEITNKKLGSASIYDKVTSKAAITDDSGRYKLLLPKGFHELQVSYIGYDRIEFRTQVTRDTIIDFYLRPLPIAVDEITILANRKRDFVGSTEMGSFILNNKEMAILPSLLGEVDPLKLIQLTPGIQTSSNGGGGFYVRGGGVDQNLVFVFMHCCPRGLRVMSADLKRKRLYYSSFRRKPESSILND